MGQLINISPHSLTMMNTGNTEFSSVEVWFPDQASTELEIVVQKTAEATGDLIGNKIADKTTSIGKSKEKEKAEKEKEIYIPPEKRQQIIDDLKLFWA